MKILSVRYYLPAIAWAGLIYFFSSQPVLPGFTVSTTDFLFKKSAHIFVYFVLYLLLYWAAFKSTSSKNARFRLILPTIICLVYAITDEIHQSFTPGRTPTLRDVGYDSLGMFIGFLGLYRYI